MSAGRPVIMGPSTYGIDFIAKPAQQAGVFETFETPHAIYTHLLALNEDLEHVQLKQKKAKAFASLNSNTAKLTFEIINRHNSYTNGS